MSRLFNIFGIPSIFRSRCVQRLESPMLAILYGNGKGRPGYAIRHGSLLARKSSIEVAIVDELEAVAFVVSPTHKSDKTT